MTKEEIAGVLEQIATLLELKAENPFKIRAYTNAARAIETFGANIANFQDEEAVAKLPGIFATASSSLKFDTFAPNVSIARAALVYARILNGFSAFNSRSVAICSRTLAISSLVITKTVKPELRRRRCGC